MKKYLVGGSVRDMLLKLPCKDYDWVVVGSTPQEMIDLGFKQVGSDFPVFLHPENGHEYAIARSERSIGNGYHDFKTSVGITLLTKDGNFVRTINPELLQKFLDAGFDLETDYDLEELLHFFNSL